MEVNGSPDPSFESDDSSYVMVTLPNRKTEETNQATNQANILLFSGIEELLAFTNQATNQATNLIGKTVTEILLEEVHDKVKAMVEFTIDWRTRKEILEQIGVTNQTYNRKKYLDPLTTIGWIEQKYKDQESHPSQAYRLSDSGERLLDLITHK